MPGRRTLLMSRSILAANISPLAQLKARASAVLKGMEADNNPLVITRNGVAAAVLVPPDEYDRLAAEIHQRYKAWA
jgi:prevent-host-death family protein